MKKFIAIFCVVIMMFATFVFVSCKDDPDETTTDAPSSETTTSTNNHEDETTGGEETTIDNSEEDGRNKNPYLGSDYGPFKK